MLEYIKLDDIIIVHVLLNGVIYFIVATNTGKCIRKIDFFVKMHLEINDCSWICAIYIGQSIIFLN